MRDDEQVSQSINASFTPPLAVRVGLGPTSDDIDYTENPVEVKGSVNNPQAIVTVNGIPMAVAEDRSFTGDVQLVEGTNTVTAVATWDGEEDRWQMMTEPHPEGGMIVIPGLGSGSHLYEERVLIDDPVTIRPGETKSVDITVESGKMDYPCEFSYTIHQITLGDPECDRVPLPERCESPLPEGLEASIEPQRFTEYANTTYHLTLTIKTTHELETGSYIVKVHHHGSMVGESGITVNVQP